MISRLTTALMYSRERTESHNEVLRCFQWVASLEVVWLEAVDVTREAVWGVFRPWVELAGYRMRLQPFRRAGGAAGREHAGGLEDGAMPQMRGRDQGL